MPCETRAVKTNRIPRWSPLLLVLGLAIPGCGGDDDGSGGEVGPLPDMPRPSKRSDISTVADPGTGTLVVFGGDDGPIIAQMPSPNYLGDTWVLDPTSGWTAVTSAGPPARGRYTVAHNPAGQMYMFGGRSGIGSASLFGDLWSFDFMSQRWSQLSDGSGGPAARWLAAGAYDADNERFIVTGGARSAAPLEGLTDIWSFDGSAWSQLTATGTAPSSRAYVAYTHDTSRNRLLIYGGLETILSSGFTDLYALDLNTMTWSLLNDGTGGPSARFWSSMSYDAASDRYLLFGGHVDPGVDNDVWSFEPTGNTWTQLSVGDTFTGNPLGCLGNDREIPKDYMSEDLTSPERRSAGAMALLGEELIIFGGESDCSDHLDDVWAFNTTANTWAELLEARSGESCARSGDDCQCLCL